jgi:hypothetical protein
MLSGGGPTVYKYVTYILRHIGVFLMLHLNCILFILILKLLYPFHLLLNMLIPVEHSMHPFVPEHNCYVISPHTGRQTSVLQSEPL